MNLPLKQNLFRVQNLGHDSESDTSIDLEIGTLSTQESEDSAEESPVHVYKKILRNQRDLHISKIKNLGKIYLEVNQIRH